MTWASVVMLTAPGFHVGPELDMTFPYQRFPYREDLRPCRTWKEGILPLWKALGNPDMIPTSLNLQKYQSNQPARHNVGLVFIFA
jgi:hypothetical protein